MESKALRPILSGEVPSERTAELSDKELVAGSQLFELVELGFVDPMEPDEVERIAKAEGMDELEWVIRTRSEIEYAVFKRIVL